VLVLGIVGRTPVAGVAWQALHYIEGFRRAGCDVFYVEDTWDWPYDAERNTVTDDPSYTLDYIGRMMRWAGFADCWAYRGPDREVHGPAGARFDRLLAESDALVNVTGATELLEEHLRVPVRIYLETDPVLPQIGLAEGNQHVRELLGAHTHHFSFGENYGTPECTVPVLEFDYLPTRQPVVLEWWDGGAAAAAGPFSTIATWDQSGDRDAEWDGKRLVWSKHEQFLDYIDLPQVSGRELELALASDTETAQMLRGHGWRVIDGLALSREILPYRDYIFGARGEFSVAKGQYVESRSGWFSDRTACYLAAGRPAIVQDTGFGRVLPTGRGLFPFSTMDDVLAAMEAIETDYEGNCRAAREIAEEHFAAERVVGRMVEQAGLGS
jgi:hypothetical protein